MKLNGLDFYITGNGRGLGSAMQQRFISEGGREDTGNMDVLVCNGAVYGPVGPFDSNPMNLWRDCINTNVLSVVALCHLVIPQMKSRRRGKIIILSGGGATRPRPNFSAYATSKAALVRFMECISAELQHYNIDVNCMAPGILNTGIHDKVIEAGPGLVGEEEYKTALMAKDGTPDFTRACDLAVWLASSESNGVTGKLISVHHDYRSLTA